MGLGEDVEAFFRLAVPLWSQNAPSRAVCYWWCRGAILRGELKAPGEIDFSIVRPDTPAMEELLRGAGPDRVIELWRSHPPVEM